MRIPSILGVGVLMVVLGGCLEPPAGRCTADADCRDGRVCQADGTCVAVAASSGGSGGASSGVAMTSMGSSAAGSGGSQGSSNAASGTSLPASSGPPTSSSSTTGGSSSSNSSSGATSAGNGSGSGGSSTSSGSTSGSSGVLTRTPDPVLRTLCSPLTPQAVFALPAGSPGGAAFSCSVNGGAAVACNSPWDVPGLAMHQEATVAVTAQLPALPASNVVTGTVRRGLNPRGVGAGAPRGILQLPDDGYLVWGDNRGVGFEVSAKAYTRILPSGAFDPDQGGLTTGSEGIYNGDVGPIVQELDSNGLPTDRFILGGQVRSFNGTPVPNNLWRIDATGAVDTSWAGADIGDWWANVGLVVQEVAANGQPNGKLLVGGEFNAVNGNSDHKGLVRLLANGTVDPTWHANGGFNDWVNAVWQVRDAAGLPTGRILVAGGFDRFDGAPIPYGLAMLTEDGALDPTFLSGTGFNGWLATVMQPRDATGAYLPVFVIGGTFTQLNGVDVPARLVRLLADGTVDATFNPGGSGFNGYYGEGAFAFLEELDGAGMPTTRFWVGGNFSDSYNDTRVDGDLFRFNANGTVDTSANALTWGSISMLTPVRNVDGTRSGKFYAIGQLEWVNNRPWTGPALFDASGVQDPVTTAHPYAGDWAWNLVQARNTSGQWLSVFHVSGNFPGWGGQRTGRGLARLASNGTPVAAFHATQGNGVWGSVRRVVNERDASGNTTGKLMVLGDFYDAFDNVDIPDGLVRLNADGSRDPLFNAGGEGLWGAEGNALLQELNAQGTPTGKWWLGHGARNYNNNSAPGGLMRIQANGYRDATFNPQGFEDVGSGGYAAQVRHLVYERDSTTGALNGKMLAAGYFDRFNGSNVPFGLVRLNADGTLDPTFNPGGAGVDGYYRTIYALVQEYGTNGVPNGKWLVGVLTDTYNGTPVRGVFRLQADGTLDPAFQVGMSGEQRVTSMVQEWDPATQSYTGRWFLAGLFGDLEGGSINVPNNIIRVEANGAWDPTFNTDSDAANGMVNAMVAETAGGVPTGNLILVGEFSAYNGAPRLGILRLLPDGTADEYFHGNGRGPF